MVPRKWPSRSKKMSNSNSLEAAGLKTEDEAIEASESKQTRRKSQTETSGNSKRVKPPCETNGKSKRLEIQITTVRRFHRGNDANRNPKRVNVQRTRRKSWLESNRNPKRVNVQDTPQRSAMLFAMSASEPPKAMYIPMPSVWSSGKHCFQTPTKSTTWDLFLLGTGLTYHRKATARTITTPAFSAGM